MEEAWKSNLDTTDKNQLQNSKKLNVSPEILKLLQQKIEKKLQRFLLKITSLMWHQPTGKKQKKTILTTKTK